MWYCSNCQKEFQSCRNWIRCPFCGSEYVKDSTIRPDNKESDFHFPKMNGEIPEHPKCSCINKESCAENEVEDENKFEQFLSNENFEGAENFEEEQTPELSFSDMDINEIVLLGLPIENMDVVPVTYIAEMNYRFLHTFVDSSFVPA